MNELTKYTKQGYIIVSTTKTKNSTIYQLSKKKKWSSFLLIMGFLTFGALLILAIIDYLIKSDSIVTVQVLND